MCGRACVCVFQEVSPLFNYFIHACRRTRKNDFHFSFLQKETKEKVKTNNGVMFLCRMSYPAMNDNTHELGKPEFFFLLHILMSFFKYPGMSTKCQYYPAMNGNIIEVAKPEFFFLSCYSHVI